ncbi:hypothetical protein GCM10023321_81310 [Pseudonocardia eucalypti]|uniref:PH domain-containing protein n=1 Tax=Pseudonocardia eucalypti TaxID=648755 RepID=A0ABP9RE92_9PSEU
MLTFTASVVLVPLVVIALLYLLIFGGELGTTLVGLAIAAVLIFVPVSLIGLAARAPVIAQAGAHILEGRHGEKVCLYELSAISVKGGKLRLAGGFQGQKSGWMSPLPLSLLESNQQLWDLVYNGLRHSAARGARVEAQTRELLRLPWYTD